MELRLFGMSQGFDIICLDCLAYTYVPHCMFIGHRCITNIYLLIYFF